MERTDELEEQPSVKPVEEIKSQNKEIITEGVTPVHDQGGGYVEFEDKLFQRDALKELRPDLFSIKADSAAQVSSNFGTVFPKIAKKGDVFVRVDVLPNRVFKFDGKRWIEINKETTSSYIDNQYLEYLIKKVQSGELDVDMLTDTEKEYLETHLKGNQNT